MKSLTAGHSDAQGSSKGLGKDEETKAQDVKRLLLREAPCPRASIPFALQGQPGATPALLQLLTDAYVHGLVTASLSVVHWLVSSPECPRGHAQQGGPLVIVSHLNVPSRVSRGHSGVCSSLTCCNHC